MEIDDSIKDIVDMSKLLPFHEIFASASLIWVIHPQTISTDRIIAMLLTHPPLFKAHKIIISDDSSKISSALGAAIPPDLSCLYSALPSYLNNLTSISVTEPTYFFPDSIPKLLSSCSSLSLTQSGRANYRIIAPISMCNTTAQLKQIEHTLGISGLQPIYLSVRPLDPGPSLDYKLHTITKSELANRCHTMIALAPQTKHLVIGEEFMETKLPKESSGTLLSFGDSFPKKPNMITAQPYGEVPNPEHIGSIHFPPENIAPEIYDRWMERIYRRELYALSSPNKGVVPVLTLTINFYIDSDSNSSYSRLAEIINERHQRYLGWEKSAKPILYDSKKGMCIQLQ